MQNAEISNNPPFSFYFRLSEFCIIQSNYSSLNEIVFTEHTSRDILGELTNDEYVVALFKIKPKVDRMAVNADGDLEAYENLFR